MKHFRIRGWPKYQHYKDRNPPWIKLHNDLLHSRTWVTLDDASKALAVACMLLASRTENEIPADPDYIQRVAYLTTRPDLQKLVDVDFIEIIDLQDDASNTLAGASTMLANRTTETETEKEKEHTSEPRVPPCPHLEIISAYHETLPERPSVMPARWKGSASERNLQARWRENDEHRSVDWWRGYFSAVRTNDWWMNGKEDGWKGVDLHWLVKRANFDKVVQHWANLS